MGNRGFFGFSNTLVDEMPINWSLAFNGTTSWISTGWTSWAGRFTVCMWINPGAVAAGKIQEIVSKRSYFATAMSDFPMSLYLENTGTLLTGQVDGGNDWNADLVVTAVTVVNAWQHVALSYNGSTLVLYVNGVPRSAAGVVAVSTNARSWAFGRCSAENAGGVNGSYFNGFMTDIRLYGSIKTQTQVVDIMNGLTDLEGLYCWWKCQEGAGTSLLDSVCQNIATLNNVTWSKNVPRG